MSREEGAAILGRLAVDGGALVETRPRRRRTLKVLDGLIFVLSVAFMSGVLVLGMHEVLR